MKLEIEVLRRLLFRFRRNLIKEQVEECETAIEKFNTMADCIVTQDTLITLMLDALEDARIVLLRHGDIDAISKVCVAIRAATGQDISNLELLVIRDR
jgi:hypothetical protein